MICDYGCGQEAKYYFKYPKKWCCSKYYNQCPVEKNKRSKKLIGIKSPLKGRKLTQNHIKKMSESRIGNKPWNKGLTKIYSKETLKKISDTKKYSIKQIKEKYPLFAKIEEMRYNPDKPGEKEIQVHCENSKKQGGWFTPDGKEIGYRYEAIEKGNGGSYIYYSQECKLECPLFNLRSDPNLKKEVLHTQHEYQIWRNEVLKRAEFLCEYCGELATHVHHSRP